MVQGLTILQNYIIVTCILTLDSNHRKLQWNKMSDAHLEMSLDMATFLITQFKAFPQNCNKSASNSDWPLPERKQHAHKDYFLGARRPTRLPSHLTVGQPPNLASTSSHERPSAPLPLNVRATLALICTHRAHKREIQGPLMI